jgi:glycogen operon protein
MRPAPVAPGARVHDDGVEFVVRSHSAKRIQLCLFDEQGAREIARIPFAERFGDLWRAFAPGLGVGARYGLRADGPRDPRAGHWFDPAKLLVDPYAARLDRPFVHSPELRASCVETAALVPRAIVERLPEAPRAAPRAPDFIYELPVKAHTRLDAAVAPAARGTLAGLVAPHVVERLVRLGVSHVELMPVAAWIDERHLPPLGLSNAWGYNPVTMMAPDPRLAPGGIADLRRVVETLRAAGIGVILDVVFNHTGESDADGPILSLRGLDNALYYRRDARGDFVNDAGCGNVLACDEPAVAQLVLDTLRHYVRHAGVDGFRFDLATVLGRDARGFSPDAPLLAAIGQDPMLRDRILIAEPWDIGPGGYQLGRFRHPWREWSDRYRDDMRRFWRGDARAIGAFATRLAGSADLFQPGARRPSASVNFIAAHDGFSLRDLVTCDAKRNHANGEDNRDGASHEICWVAEDAGRDARALLATLILSRGTPMLTAGDEFGRTQNGNNNAYAQDNATTWLDWDRADDELAQFVAGLARLRARMPALTEDRFLTGRVGQGGAPDVVWSLPDGRPFTDADWADGDGLALTLAPAEGPGARLHLVFNRGAERALTPPPPAPGLRWRLALDSAAGFVAPEGGADAPSTAPARGVLALVETA